MEKIRLGDIAKISSGGTPSRNKRENWENGDIPWIKIKDLKSKYINSSEENITKYALKNSTTKLYKKGTILYTIFATIGEVAILNIDATTNQAIAGIEINEKVINRNYLFYYLNSIKTKMVKKSRGVAQNNINLKILKNLEIKLVELSEQKKISNKLDKVQEIIDLRKKQIKELDGLIKSQFVEMFGDLGNTKYEVKTLEELVDKSDKNSLKRGPFGGSLKKDDFVDDGYLVYEQRHAIHNDFEYEKYYIDEEKYKSMEMFKVMPGDLIVSCSGVTLGRIAEIPENAKEGIINQALLKISLNNRIIVNEFFIQQFRSEEIQNYLFSFSRGSGIPNFPSMNEVKKIKLICPNLEEQIRYERIVKQIDKRKIEIEESLRETEELQESLMNKYFGE